MGGREKGGAGATTGGLGMSMYVLTMCAVLLDCDCLPQAAGCKLAAFFSELGEGNHHCSADRTVALALKPFGDAVRMKTMRAAWQHNQTLTSHKRFEAHHA